MIDFARTMNWQVEEKGVQNKSLEETRKNHARSSVQPLNRFIAMRKIIIFVCSVFAGCATYTGDKLVSLTQLSPKPANHANLLKVEEKLLKLYDELDLPEKRKISIDPISTYGLVQEHKNIKFAHEKQKVFLIDGDVHISHCHSSIVIATGNIDISHGSNNILISGNNIEVSHDRGGSIIVARGIVDISFAYNTTVYAVGGLEISHPRNVIAYNTENRKTSWGHVNNILIEPLFKSQTPFNKSIHPTAGASAD